MNERRNREGINLIIEILIALWIACVGYLIFAKHGQAAAGMPLMKGLNTPTELATLVETSLVADPAGNRVLDPARCQKNGSCATAHDYLEGIRLAHPSAGLTSIAELPRYLRSLVSRPAPDGEWHMSRLLVKGSSHRYDATGWHRAFFKGEKAWYDVNTGEPILAGDCYNIVGKRIDTPSPDQCVELAFHAPVRGEVRWGVGTREGALPPSACNAQRQGNGVWTSWLDQCDWCTPNVGYISQVLGGTATVPQKFKYAVTETAQTLRFAHAVQSRVVYICLEYPGGVQTCGVYMRPQDWHGRTHVDIADQLWRREDGNCPK